MGLVDRCSTRLTVDRRWRGTLACPAITFFFLFSIHVVNHHSFQPVSAEDCPSFAHPLPIPCPCAPHIILLTSISLAHRQDICQKKRHFSSQSYTFMHQTQKCWRPMCRSSQKACSSGKEPRPLSLRATAHGKASHPRYPCLDISDFRGCLLS